MPRKIDLGEALAALGALLLLGAVFLVWFDGASGWEAFEALDLVLALLALAVLAVAISATEAIDSRLLAPLGLLLLFIIVVQLVEPPPAIADGDLGPGAWLALAGAGLVLVGGALRVARISVTVSIGGKDPRRRVAAVDRRHGGPSPAPAPAEPTASAPVREEAVRVSPFADTPTEAFSPVEERES